MIVLSAVMVPVSAVLSPLAVRDSFFTVDGEGAGLGIGLGLTHHGTLADEGVLRAIGQGQGVGVGESRVHRGNGFLVAAHVVAENILIGYGLGRGIDRILRSSVLGAKPLVP